MQELGKSTRYEQMRIQEYVNSELRLEVLI